MTYDASSRKDVRKAEKSAARAERNRGEVLRTLASTTAGRQFLWEQLEAAHIFTTPYSSDTNQTYFNLGEQNAGLRLLTDITRYCPEEFIQAMREANARRTESDTSAIANATAERPSSEDADGGVEGSTGSQLDYNPTAGAEES